MKQATFQEEIHRIFSAIFRAQPPQSLVERYDKAAASLFANVPNQEALEIRRIIESSRDLEAVEFASRLTGRLPLLRAKFRLVVSLAECDPTLRRHFVNNQDFRFGGWVFLAGHSFRSFVKLLSGLWILHRLRSSTHD